jgi:thiol-disulfide isomerase/thioredoxin
MATSEPRAKLGKGLTLAIAAVLAIGAGGVLYVMSGALKPAGAPDLQSFATGGIAKLQVSKPAPPPSTPFKDAEGKTVTLQPMVGGGVTLVNIWATWCGPCVKEMPTLATLAKDYGPKGLKIIPVSVDKAKDTEAAKAFIGKHSPLPFYQDAELELPFAFDPPTVGYPTTVVYDKKGIERARIVGEAEWASPEAKAMIDTLLQE